MQFKLLLFLSGVFLSFQLTSAWFFNKKCYDEMEERFRCYNINYPYMNTLFHYPRSPSRQNIQFKLYTPRTRFTPQLLDPKNESSIANSRFNAGGKVAFVIHGFTDSSIKVWVTKMVNELVKVVPNVIAVDWKEGAKGPNYYQAVANTRVVGAHLASFIHSIGQRGVANHDVHLIGHSLGAHVAGYAGEKFGLDVKSDHGYSGTQKIGRITGLDPASPAFEEFNRQVKLDRNDATFVDVIHTDAPTLVKGAGVEEETGHVDFYPNGGSRMPGCRNKVVTLFKTWDLKSLACSHRRAVDYFTASINLRRNDFQAFPCKYRHFWKFCKTCGDRGCNKMGYHANPLRTGLFVLATKKHYPF